MKLVRYLTLILVIVGGLNWGSVGLLDKNFVNMLLGQWPMVEKVVYILVGLAAVFKAASSLRGCQSNSEGGSCCHREEK